MKKRNNKKSLPKFKAVTLGEDELSKAVCGGIAPAARIPSAMSMARPTAME